MYYDISNNQLIVLTGNQNSITVIDYNQSLQKYIYQTQNNFSKNLTCFVAKYNLIIIVDQTPQIIIYNYLNNVAQISPISFNQLFQLVLDVNNNFIYIQSQQSVHVFQVPEMNYYESLNDNVKMNNIKIQKMQLLTELNALFVIRSDQVILVYDLIETIIQEEKSFINEIQIQFIEFENFTVTYNILSSSLLLFKDRIFKDELLLDLTFFTVQKCDMFKLDQQVLIFISPLRIFKIFINFQTNKFEIIHQLEINESYTDVLFDKFNQRLILINQQSNQVSCFYLISTTEITIVGKLFQNYQQIIIQQSNIIYSSNNMIMSQHLSNLELNIQLKLGYAKINYLIKLNECNSLQFDDRLDDINQSNIYDTQNDNLILVIQNDEKTIYTVNTLQLIVVNLVKIDYQTLNVVIDRNRKIIFLVSNVQYTFIYDFSLKLLSKIKNPCLISAKIYFDDQFIYSVCSSSVYFYNSLTLTKQNFQINSGFSGIEFVKKLNTQRMFILVEQNSIYIIEFQQNDTNSIKILFQKQKQKMYIQKATIIDDDNHQKYFEILGISWGDVIYYLIPYETQNECTASFILSNPEMNSQQIKIIQENANITKQTASQIQIEIQNDQKLSKITSLYHQSTSLEIQIYTKNKNTIVWDDGSIVDDPNIGELVIRDAQLNITNNLILNQKKNINQVLLYNLDFINIKNQIIFENISKVIFFNITLSQIIYYGSVVSQPLFIFRNCKIVILENVTINYVNSNNQTIFQYDNCTKIVIKDFNVTNSYFFSLFSMNKAESAALRYLNFENNTNYFQSVIQGIQVDQIDFSYLNISKTQQNQIFDFQGCSNISLRFINGKDVKDIILLSIKPYENYYIFPTNELKIQNFFINHSQNVGFFLESDELSVLDSQFQNLVQNNTSLINSKLSNITIIGCTFENIRLSLGQSILKQINFNNFILQKSNFLEIDGNLIYLLNQNSGYEVQFNSLKMIDNFASNVILINLVQKVFIRDSFFINQISQQNGGVFNIQNTLELFISESQFEQNQSILGSGGSLFFDSVLSFLIQNSDFKENQSQNESGGAISIIQKQQAGYNSQIINSKFHQNKALQGLGGAIAIINCDLNLKNTTIMNNKASIGGGMHYQLVIPQIIQYKLIEQNNNTIKDNECLLYGQNIGSTLRKLILNLKKNPLSIIEEENQQKEILISNFRSGDNLFIDEIQILDEENNLFKYDSSLKYSQSAVEIIQKSTMTINQKNQNEQMKILGGTIITYQQGKFSFNVSISYFPEADSTFQLQTQKMPPLYDSKGKEYIEQKQLQLEFKINFRKCLIGEIQKNFFSSIICEGCPDGKYSLHLQDQSCKICPSSAVECQGSQIKIKNGYWRSNIETDLILYCKNAPNNCQPENQESKILQFFLLNQEQFSQFQNLKIIIMLVHIFYFEQLGCTRGYVGPLCEQCDFFGNLWGQRYQKVFSSFQCSKCSDMLLLAGIQQTLFIIFLTLYIYVCNRKIINSIERDLQNYYIKMLGLLYLNNSGINLVKKLIFIYLILKNKKNVFSIFSNLNLPQISGKFSIKKQN